MTGKPLHISPVIKQEGLHTLVYSLPRFHTQNAQTCEPERVEKET